MIVCFGDSLTAGYGAETSQSYPSLLRRRVTVPVFNAGISGETTADALLRIQRDVLDRDPGLVIVEFGANDFLQDLYNSAIDVDGVRVRFRTMLHKLADGKRKIFVVKFYVYDMIRFYLDDNDMEVYDAFEQMFASLEEEYPIEIIENIWDGIWGRPELMFDNIHPNAAGYRKMAELYFKAIDPWLKENNLLK
ncbi:MAG: GDSL-type esterase/lipase family protein [Treponema sp.]|nr:GDSL-type esterase/lipase family protein [Treponema sp.]